MMEAKNQNDAAKYNENNRVIYCPKTPIKPNGMICYECEELYHCFKGYMSYYAKLPHFIIDHYSSKSNMSHTSFVIFIYLCRKANYDATSNHYGRCWQTLEQISDVTGISVNNMRKYLNELQGKGLITWKFTRIKEKEGYKTTHEFNILHYKYLNDIRSALIKLQKQVEQEDKKRVKIYKKC